MKSFIKAIAVAAVLAVPAVSFAQSNGEVTRAQVRAELAQVQQAERNSSLFDQGDAHYPQGMLDAEAKVNAQNASTQAAAYGPATGGTSQAGHADQAAQAPASGNDWFKSSSYSHP